MATRTQLLTAEEFWSLPSSRWTELVDGVPIEMCPPGYEATTIAGTITWLLSAHVRLRALGYVLTDPGVILRRNPDAVRAPDAAFIRAARMPPGRPPRGFSDIVPDLIVEVVSPGNTAVEIQAKIREWLEAGARLVWVVYPNSRTVEVIRSLCRVFDRAFAKMDDQRASHDVAADREIVLGEDLRYRAREPGQDASDFPARLTKAVVSAESGVEVTV